MIADQFLESNLWTMLWSRVAQSLKPVDLSENNETETVETVETTSTARTNIESQASIDWTLISPNGYLSLLQLASRMLTVSTQNCAALILRDDSLMFDTLSSMLSERFLSSVKKR